VAELDILVRSASQTGELQTEEAEMVTKVFDLPERQARHALTPRTEIVAWPQDLPVREAIERAVRGHHSRYPIYAGDLDHIIGVVHVKDLLRASVHPEMLDKLVVGDLAREVAFVPESAPLNTVLVGMRQKNAHLAVVFDEYGGTAGIITLEDLLEEIVGQVQDEFEADQPPPVLETAPNHYRVNGLVGVAELNEELGLSLPEDESTSIGGLIFGRLGRPAEVGDEITIGRYHFTVRELDERRIAWVDLDILEDAEQPAGEARER
jgi:CBS domain containing-hemolysin-like protein